MSIEINKSPDDMKLENMGSRYPSRLSFSRSMLRKLIVDNWKISKTKFDLDEDGYIIQDYDNEVNDDDDITNMSNKTFFEGMCVLEEFLKEVAGILKAREELNMLT